MLAATAHQNDPSPTAVRRVDVEVGTYRIWHDGPVLRIEARGIWDLAAGQAYADDIGRTVAQWRQSATHLRAIVDRRDMPIFQADAHELLVATYRRILRPGDRIALVVESSLAKAPVRQLADREETQVFLSISAARTWVLAYD